MRNPEQTIGNMLDKNSVVYVGSIDECGYPNVKAMFAPRKREGIEKLYFTSNLSSLRAHEFSSDDRACVYVCDRRFFRGAMLTGKIEVLTGADIKSEIWKTGDEMYYSGGVTDPDYCVLAFTAERGRYYADFKSENFTVKQ